jgi:hypothetical protein
MAEQYRQQIEEKLHFLHLLVWKIKKKGGTDVKQSLIPSPKGYWESWKQPINERGLMLNARLQ